MNGFNEGLRNLLEDVFEQINVTKDEIVCVGYDDGHWFRYRNGEWW